MNMSVMPVRLVRTNPFCAALALGLLCCIPTWGQGNPTPSLQQLYLLAGTTSQHTPQSYPVVLYRVGKDRRLELVREVVRQSDGIRFVYAWGDAIFFLYPHDSVTSVSIVHTNEPTRADDVVFSSDGVTPSPSASAIVVPPGSAAALLIPWITNLADPANPPSRIAVTDAKVSSSSGGPGPRVQLDTWSDYAYLRSEGAPGGPNYVAALIGSAEGDNLAINFFGHTTVIDKLPPKLRRTNNEIVPSIVAASEEYLILCRQLTWEEVKAGKLGGAIELYVQDRTKDRWNTVQSESNSSTLRLFGPWLTTIVATWSPNHEVPNPGRENERPQEDATDRLPPVQILYRSFVGHNVLLPGILVLQNLNDGRKIRIETGQEDSEILRVEGDAVLYRVNDTIYQARIAGDKLQDTVVVVKDEDVPEVHWVFWGK